MTRGFRAFATGCVHTLLFIGAFVAFGFVSQFLMASCAPEALCFPNCDSLYCTIDQDCGPYCACVKKVENRTQGICLERMD